jgi:hypothetical protein
MQGETNMAENDTSTPDGKAVPTNKKSEKLKKKRLRVVNSSDSDEENASKAGHSTGEDEEGDGNGENLSEAELIKRERE